MHHAAEAASRQAGSLVDDDEARLALEHLGRKARLQPELPRERVAAPGEQLQVAFSAKDGEGKQVAVPVVLDQYPYGSASPSHPDSRADESGSKAAH